MFCSKCGAKAAERAEFCSGCGSALELNSAEPESEPILLTDLVYSPRTLKANEPCKMPVAARPDQEPILLTDLIYRPRRKARDKHRRRRLALVGGTQLNLD